MNQCPHRQPAPTRTTCRPPVRQMWPWQLFLRWAPHPHLPRLPKAARRSSRKTKAFQPSNLMNLVHHRSMFPPVNPLRRWHLSHRISKGHLKIVELLPSPLNHLHRYRFRLHKNSRIQHPAPVEHRRMLNQFPSVATIRRQLPATL